MYYNKFAKSIDRVLYHDLVVSNAMRQSYGTIQFWNDCMEVAFHQELQLSQIHLLTPKSHRLNLYGHLDLPAYDDSLGLPHC